MIDELAPESVPGRTTLAEAEFNKTALASKNLGRELPTILAGHSSLHTLYNRGDRAPVVLEVASQEWWKIGGGVIS